MIKVKGKGKMLTYFLVRSKSLICS